MDGTLADTDAANSAAYRAALARAGVKNMFGLVGRVTADVVRAAMGDGVSVALDDIVRMKIDAYCGELWRASLGPACEDFRCVLLNRSIFDKVVLLSDSSERRVVETLNHFGWKNLFDEIVCNGGRGDKYANYFKSFDSDPAASVVWENENRQIHAAIAAGVRNENIRKVA
jgi:beta-phosphoglucomutase-like phosphatase (HAD superfamily)